MGIKKINIVIFASAVKKGENSVSHVCFINYKGPSKSMETDILVEGFRISEEMHGLQYLRYIGDGDSSVFYRLKQSVPYGSFIEKEECANHVTKNYTKYLHGLVKAKKGIYTKVLPNNMIQKLTKNLRGAIKKNSEDQGTAEKLRDLLRRGPEHVFGNHSKCDDACPKKAGLPEGSLAEDRWRSVPKEVFQDIQAGIEIVCRKADMLRMDSTTNLAENYMSVAVKFCGGKQISRSKRWAYHARINGASLSYSMGPKWHSHTWKKAFGSSPAKLMKQYCEKTSRLRTQSRRNLKQYYVSMGGRYQAKRKNNQSFSGVLDYGPKCNRPDMRPEELEAAKVTYTKTFLNYDQSTLQQIYEKTKGQSSNEQWIYERSKKITSTFFHRITSRKEITKTGPIVRDIRIGGSNYRSAEMIKGNELEEVALTFYEKKVGQPITKGNNIGLLVHPTCQYLAASLDGMLPDGTPIEVKTVHNIPQGKTIEDGARIKGLIKGFFLQITSSGLKLKVNHKYYSRIQGQPEITNQELCHLLVYNNQEDWKIIIVERSRQYWAKVFPKLERFWKDCLLPEIVDSRMERSLEIREPDYVTMAIDKKQTVISSRNKKRASNSEEASSKKRKTDKDLSENKDFSLIDWSELDNEQ